MTTNHELQRKLNALRDELEKIKKLMSLDLEDEGKVDEILARITVLEESQALHMVATDAEIFTPDTETPGD